MLFLILKGGSNHQSSYTEYPEWATYTALVILGCVIYILWKGKKKHK
jgi:hypothetical protein